MIERKYEFTEETKKFCGRILHRIRAVRSFNGVKKGDLGGFIKSEDNLSHNGMAWVYLGARVYDTARVYGNAQIYGDARIYGKTDYITVEQIGSRFDTTTFFKTANSEIYVSCGCFRGSITEFREKVKKTHGVDTKYAKVYQSAANLAEMQILDREVDLHEM